MTFPKPNFPQDVISSAKEHLHATYPNEGCGLIANGQFVPCENVAADKAKQFAIAPEIVATYPVIDAVVHSHPDGVAVPSEADMQSQIEMDCIYGVTPTFEGGCGDFAWWGDFTLELPLIGREFVHGITDCYSLARAYLFQVQGIKLADMPRDDEWWNKDKNLYVENYVANGFRVIPREEVVAGDFFIGHVRSKVPNHGGVILERGLGLHHLTGSLSRREPILRWEKFITHYFRYGE
jgi:proteasome lid subunit RPN8/RPN11